MSLEAWGDESDWGPPDGYVTEDRADEMVMEAMAEYRARFRKIIGYAFLIGFAAGLFLIETVHRLGG